MVTHVHFVQALETSSPHGDSFFTEFLIHKARFRHIHLDIVAPLPPSNGCCYIVTMIDRFSRCAEAAPITDRIAAAAAHHFVSTCVSRFEVLEVITTDRGR